MNIIENAKKSVRLFHQLGSAVIADVERQHLFQYFPAKPRVINLLANDICNSRCAMCLIWERKRGTELSGEEFEKILSDPLFSAVRHVGVTGGEPTLRRDLPELFDIICKMLPSLEGASTITNAINEKQVIERVSQSARICQDHGKYFSFMVSLDGVGEVHDLNRGRKGNFASAVNVIHHFQTENLPLSVGCTITKHNLWGVDELLEFCIGEGIYVRFRIAEFINRLYNNLETEVIRSFTGEEAYHLALFFERLIRTYETDATIQRTYHNIRDMLIEQSPRKIGCPYQTRGVVLDCRGQLMYCAPKSKIIGNALENSATYLYRQNLTERRRILREECGDCIHDYHTSPTTQEIVRRYQQSAWKKVFTLRTMQHLTGWMD